MAKTLTDPDVKIREYRGLLEAMHAYGLTEGLILTMDEPRPKGRGMLWEGFRTPPKFGSE